METAFSPSRIREQAARARPTSEGHDKLGIFLIDLPRSDMERRLGDALRVYIDAMDYPPETADQRAVMWLEHSSRPGWKAVAAVAAESLTTGSGPGSLPTQAELVNLPLLGVAYGYPGAPGQWWQQQVAAGMHHSGHPHDEVVDLLSDYFELTELHVSPHAQGCGLGEAMLRRLLGDRPERHVLLSTPESSGELNRAWRLYRRLGFTDLIRDYYFAGDPRAFAVLGRTLPLDASGARATDSR